jgi:hypothetical protein
MLKEVCAKLDAWVIAQNLEARETGLPTHRPCSIRLLGQMALLESKTPLQLNLTNDVDVYANYEHAVEVEFRRLLAAHGKHLDPAGHEIWMPRETRYTVLFAGEYVSLQVADSDAVLLSKALKAPAKNRALIVQYLAAGVSERFSMLAQRYDLDLEAFV